MTVTVRRTGAGRGSPVGRLILGWFGGSLVTAGWFAGSRFAGPISSVTAVGFAGFTAGFAGFTAVGALGLSGLGLSGLGRLGCLGCLGRFRGWRSPVGSLAGLGGHDRRQGLAVGSVGRGLLLR